MRTPEKTFNEIWQSKVRSETFTSYVSGQNLRVDEAIKNLAGGKRFLDIGCGAGMLGKAVSGRYEEVYGIDIAEDAVRLARQNGVLASRADLNSEELPFDSGFFGSVTALSVLQYVYDPEHALREFHRVLVPGGELLLSVPNMRSLGKLYRVFVRGRFPQTAKAYNIGCDGGAIHYFCSNDLLDLLNKTGFAVVFRKGIFCRPKLIDKLPDSLGILSNLKTEFFGGEVFVKARG
jgi:2-polyprenyl-3-methyl-5-hydroxy-6-metoxy-1,4-benzoquinol methylase